MRKKALSIVALLILVFSSLNIVFADPSDIPRPMGTETATETESTE